MLPSSVLSSYDITVAAAGVSLAVAPLGSDRNVFSESGLNFFEDEDPSLPIDVALLYSLLVLPLVDIEAAI